MTAISDYEGLSARAARPAGGFVYLIHEGACRVHDAHARGAGGIVNAIGHTVSPY